MKKRIHITLIAAITVAGIFNSGCHKINCIDGNGNLTTETRSIDPFSALITEGFFDVEIIQDTITELIIEGEENILPYISTLTDDGVLTIKLREQRCIDNTLPVNIILRTPSLENITLDGSGEVKCDSLDTHDMTAKILGSGDIHLFLDSSIYLDASIIGSGNFYLVGYNRESELKISGSGNIKAGNLEQEDVFANISGAGNMYVWVNSFLDVKISGSGNVYYTGNPTINVTITGSGSVIHNK